MAVLPSSIPLPCHLFLILSFSDCSLLLALLAVLSLSYFSPLVQSSESTTATFEHVLSDVLDMLPTLAAGLDVNVQFTRCVCGCGCG